MNNASKRDFSNDMCIEKLIDIPKKYSIQEWRNTKKKKKNEREKEKKVKRRKKGTERVKELYLRDPYAEHLRRSPDSSDSPT